MRTIRVLVLAGLLLATVAGSAGAAGFIGEFCWQLGSFSDVIRLSITQGGTQFLLNGTMSSADYTLPFTGNLSLSGSQALVGGVFTHTGTHLGGCRALAMTATLSTSTGNGPYNFQGIGCAFGPVTAGAWTLIPCPAASPGTGTEGVDGEPVGNQQ